jgi:hypothetical protein
VWVTRRVEFTRVGAGMGVFSYPCAVAGNPTDTTWRVRVATTRVRTRCHLETKGSKQRTSGERGEGTRERKKKKSNIYYMKTLPLCEIISIDNFC